MKKLSLLVGLVFVLLASTTVLAALPGDANGDGRVDKADLQILREAFSTSSNPNADFNQDGFVDILDFTILASKWGSAGGATIAIVPTKSTVTVGEMLVVDVQVQAGSQRVDSASFFLVFHPEALEAVDASGAPVAELPSEDLGTALGFVTTRSVDHGAGLVSYGAISTAGPVTGTFKLATLRFKVAGIDSGKFWLVFLQGDNTKVTQVGFQGSNVTGNLVEPAGIVVASGIAPTPTPVMAMATPTQTAVPAETPVPATGTPVPTATLPTQVYQLERLPEVEITLPWNTFGNAGYIARVILKESGEIVRDQSDFSYSWSLIAPVAEITPVQSTYNDGCLYKIIPPCPFSDVQIQTFGDGVGRESLVKVQVFKDDIFVQETSFLLTILPKPTPTATTVPPTATATPTLVPPRPTSTAVDVTETVDLGQLVVKEGPITGVILTLDSKSDAPVNFNLSISQPTGWALPESGSSTIGLATAGEIYGVSCESGSCRYSWKGILLPNKKEQYTLFIMFGPGGEAMDPRRSIRVASKAFDLQQLGLSVSLHKYAG